MFLGSMHSNSVDSQHCLLLYVCVYVILPILIMLFGNTINQGLCFLFLFFFFHLSTGHLKGSMGRGEIVWKSWYLVTQGSEPVLLDLWLSRASETPTISLSSLLAFCSEVKVFPKLWSSPSRNRDKKLIIFHFQQLHRIKSL